MEPQPIEAAPIDPFKKDLWYMEHSPRLLLWSGHWSIGYYGYTKRGKGRWIGPHGAIKPTHFLPLPPDVKV